MTTLSTDRTSAEWIIASARSWQGTHLSAMFGMEESLRIGRAWTRRLVACIPELILNRSFGSKKSELPTLWNLDNGSCPVHIEGVVSCHALGVMGDTIELLADLGRAARIATALGKQKCFAVMLAGKEWSGYNRIAKDYGTGNIDEFEEWRLKLYTSLGCQVHYCDLEFEPDGRKRVKDLARKYVELAKFLFGEDRVGPTLSANEASVLKTSALPESKALLKIGLIADKIKPDWQVIEKVAQYLNRLDLTTFIYYLTQRFQQYAFRNYLKVAVRSEKNFDPPFLELDRGTSKRGIERALYFKEYILRDDTVRPLFVIPYYFPSGNLYEGRRTPLSDYRDAVILVDRVGDFDHALEVFGKMPFPSNARLLGDLLSFVHVWLFPLTQGRIRRRGEDVEEPPPPDRTEQAEAFATRLADIDEELAVSWKLYGTQQGLFENLLLQWGDNLWGGGRTDMPLPYFFLPFWWLQAGEVESTAKAASVLVAVLELLSTTLDAPSSPRDES